MISEVKSVQGDNILINVVNEVQMYKKTDF